MSGSVRRRRRHEELRERVLQIPEVDGAHARHRGVRVGPLDGGVGGGGGEDEDEDDDMELVISVNHPASSPAPVEPVEESWDVVIREPEPEP